MIAINLLLEPHVGVPLVNRAETEAGRRFRCARRDGQQEPFERCLADAYACLLSSSGSTSKARKPELVVLVSHEITKRGWKDAREGEPCKIPGVGPISAQRAKEIAQDAFLSGLFYDGTDLRHFRRWTRNTPVGVLTALQLGEPPEYGSAEVGVGILMTGSSASIAGAAFATRRTIARLMSPGPGVDHQSQVALLWVPSEQDRRGSQERKAHTFRPGCRAGTAGVTADPHFVELNFTGAAVGQATLIVTARPH
jgi:hypothetical protein